MLTEFEGKVVKAIETIAECLVKSNEMGSEALKKSNQLYESNMAMIRERYDKELKIEIIKPIDDAVLSNLMQDELQTPDSNTPISKDEDDMEDDMPF